MIRLRRVQGAQNCESSSAQSALWKSMHGTARTSPHCLQTRPRRPGTGTNQTGAVKAQYGILGSSAGAAVPVRAHPWRRSQLLSCSQDKVGSHISGLLWKHCDGLALHLSQLKKQPTPRSCHHAPRSSWADSRLRKNAGGTGPISLQECLCGKSSLGLYYPFVTRYGKSASTSSSFGMRSRPLYAHPPCNPAAREPGDCSLGTLVGAEMPSPGRPC